MARSCVHACVCVCVRVPHPGLRGCLLLPSRQAYLDLNGDGALEYHEFVSLYALLQRDMVNHRDPSCFAYGDSHAD
jgi:hypothetical protein